MVHLAYMISVYLDPEHLKRLIKALYVPGQTDFFIHVDKRVDIEPFLISEEPYKSVVHYTERHKVYWGGFNQVLYIKSLLESVRTSGIAFDRVVLLSGLDYPLWSNKHIFSVFEQNPESEYIMGIDLSVYDGKQQVDSIIKYHPFRDSDFPLRMIGSKLMNLIGIRKPRYVKISGKQCHVYKGSDYWSLTAACASYVLDKMNSEKLLMNYFKSSYIPSEMVANTIALNSPYAVNAISKPITAWKGLGVLTPLHYIDYGQKVKVLTLEDFDKINKTNKMFFRKSMTGTSDELLKKVDELRALEMS
jgi:hypothetical protein